MINLAIAAGAMILVFVLFALWLGGWAAIIPAVVTFMVAYFLLARRSGKQLTQVIERSMKHLEVLKVNPQRVTPQVLKLSLNKTISSLKTGYTLGRWQLMVKEQLDMQVGTMYFLLEDKKSALDHLRAALGNERMAKIRGVMMPSNEGDAMAWAMYAVCLYHAKEIDTMLKALQQGTSANPKISFIWAVGAWLCEDVKKRDRAVELLSEGVKNNPSDEGLKANLNNLRNDKKLSMKPWGDMWYQLKLEPHPAAHVGPRPGFRR